MYFFYNKEGVWSTNRRYKKLMMKDGGLIPPSFLSSLVLILTNGGRPDADDNPEDDRVQHGKKSHIVPARAVGHVLRLTSRSTDRLDISVPKERRHSLGFLCRSNGWMMLW